MKCNKCECSSSVTLRKKDNYCENCFLLSTNHKFRACIGKNKILSKNDKVLVCLSGGAGSTAMLDLIHYGISMDAHKKLRIIPYFLHVAGSDDKSSIQAIVESCKKYGFDFHLVFISDFLSEVEKLPAANVLPDDNIELAEEFDKILINMPPTARNDFLSKARRLLYIKYARLLECKYIFTGETTGTLAINLLSNLAIGRGSQVESDIGFVDARDNDIKILRPMKDISSEELDYYINIKGLSSFKPNTDTRSTSLQTLIGSFVTDLQENFQSTVSAVCKTADKIGISKSDSDVGKCTICESSMDMSKNKLTALEATNFSRTVSFGSSSGVQENGISDTLFPLINERLCYSCSRNYSETNNHSPYLNKIIYQKCTKTDTKRPVTTKGNNVI